VTYGSNVCHVNAYEQIQQHEIIHVA